MRKIIVLDTCALPQKGAIRDNPVLSALIRISELREATLAISEITRAETLGKRRREAQEAIDGLESAISAAGKVFGPDAIEYYLPSVEDAVLAWQEDIDKTFTKIDLDHADATAALHREVERKAPARPTADGSAIGSRDAAIWLSVVRLHAESADLHVTFVTANTKDFCESKGKDLKSELLEDVDEAGRDRFKLTTSLGAAVAELSESVPARPWNDVTSAVDGVEQGMRELIMVNLRVALSNRGETVEIVQVELASAAEKRSYQVEGTRLSRIEAKYAVSVKSQEGVLTSSEGKAALWLYKSGADESMSLDTLDYAGTSVLS